MSTRTALPELLALAAPIVAAVLRHPDVAAALRDALGTAGLVYTSKAPPPGMKRRAFNETCRGIPTARKNGSGWAIDASAWDAAMQARRPRRAATVISGPWTASGALAAASARAAR